MLGQSCCKKHSGDVVTMKNRDNMKISSSREARETQRAWAIFLAYTMAEAGIYCTFDKIEHDVEQKLGSGLHLLAAMAK